MSKKKNSPATSPSNDDAQQGEVKTVTPHYFLRQSETVCGCGVERSEEDPEFADLPMPEPWGALCICRHCGALYCAKKKSMADEPEAPAPEAEEEA